MGLTDKIRQAAQKSGANKGKIIFVKDGEKKRVRFLQELDDGCAPEFHSNFNRGVNALCQEQFSRKCPYCGDEELKLREEYVWSVWDYDSNEVKLIKYPVNNTTPVAALLALSENYGTIMDRDYTICCQGKQQNRTFSVIPQDKNRFKNAKAKPYTKSAVMKILDKAFPASDDTGDGIDSEGNDYDEMSASELYKLCKEKDIDVLPRKEKDYYIDRLADSNGESDDDWGDESESEYDGMSAAELYKLCKEKDIKAEKRKGEKYYIGLLEEAKQAEDDWGDNEDDEAGDDDWGDEGDEDSDWD